MFKFLLHPDEMSTSPLLGTTVIVSDCVTAKSSYVFSPLAYPRQINFYCKNTTMAKGYNYL